LGGYVLKKIDVPNLVSITPYHSHSLMPNPHDIISSQHKLNSGIEISEFETQETIFCDWKLNAETTQQ
jgi:hypothetical protein